MKENRTFAPLKTKKHMQTTSKGCRLQIKLLQQDRKAAPDMNANIIKEPYLDRDDWHPF